MLDTKTAKPKATKTPIEFSQWARDVLYHRLPTSLEDYKHDWGSFFDYWAGQLKAGRLQGEGYRSLISSLAGFYILPGSRVLEVGSGDGDLLNFLKPSYGVGIDLSASMTSLASARHPNLKFHTMAAEELQLEGEEFDYILFSDVAGYLYDFQETFQRLRSVCHDRTRVIIHWPSRLWRPLYKVAEVLGLRRPLPLINWPSVKGMANVLHLEGFESVRLRRHILMPARFGFAGRWINKFFAHLPLLNRLCLTNWIIARPLGLKPAKNSPSVSVVCPCRNESGTIRHMVERMPSLGSHTEFILVEGNSKDDTLEQCRYWAKAYEGKKDVKVLVQKGKGKFDAMLLGFSQASGDILMVIDSDLCMDPESLKFYYDAMVSGKGELVISTRFFYARDSLAMRPVNHFGNRFFAKTVQWIAGQRITDTMGSIKAICRSDYERIPAQRSYFGGGLDPFCEFDLILGSTRLNLKIAEIPARYRDRIYGTTNISRFTDGWQLIKMCWIAARNMVFV